MLDNPNFFINKQVKILLVKTLNIFLVKLIFLPFEWKLGLGSPGNEVGLWTMCKQNGGRHVEKKDNS